jgi:prophage regulatory protein
LQSVRESVTQRSNITRNNDTLAALISELADLQGRAMEINSRIARETQLLAETQHRMIAALAKIPQAVTAPPPSPAAAAPELGPRVLRTAEAARRIGLSKSSLWRMVKDGEFPRPRQLSAHAVGWLESEIARWLNDRQATGVKPECITPRRNISKR